MVVGFINLILLQSYCQGQQRCSLKSVMCFGLPYREASHCGCILSHLSIRLVKSAEVRCAELCPSAEILLTGAVTVIQVFYR